MITIYTKDYCPYCVKAKSLLTSIGADFQEIDITNDPDTMRKIYEISHLRTVPQIFVSDTCLGGYDSIQSLHDAGELREKLGISK